MIDTLFELGEAPKAAGPVPRNWYRKSALGFKDYQDAMRERAEVLGWLMAEAQPTEPRH